MPATTDAPSGDARRPVAATIGVVVRGDEVLLVRRANPPDAGKWGYPGGKIELGEGIAAAAEREMREETGVTVRALQVITAVDSLHHDGGGAVAYHYVMIAVLCEWQSGEPAAADDALDAGWFSLTQLEQGELDLSSGVVELARRAVGMLRQLG